MRKFSALFITAFLCVNAEPGFLDEWSVNFEQNMQNFGRQLSRDIQQQGRAIQEETRRITEQAKAEEKKRQGELKRQKDEIMETVKKIQEGSLPTGVNSANTTTLNENVNGRLLTIKTTVYSTGNEKEGIIRNVQIISEGEKVIDWSVNSLIWNEDQLKKRLVSNAPQSRNNQFGSSQSVVINSGSEFITTSGGSVINSGGTNIINSNIGGMIVQEVTL